MAAKKKSRRPNSAMLKGIKIVYLEDLLRKAAESKRKLRPKKKRAAISRRLKSIYVAKKYRLARNLEDTTAKFANGLKNKTLDELRSIAYFYKISAPGPTKAKTINSIRRARKCLKES